MADDEKSLGELEQEFWQARDELDAAEVEAESARRNATAARNRFNELSKRIGKRIEELKKNSPQDTDWAREARR